MKQRIQKALAAAGVASRRNIEQMVLEGRISVNGTVVRALPVMVDLDEDRIEVDHDLIKPPSGTKREKLVYILMNKPRGVHCTNVSQGMQTRAIDLLGEGFPYRVFPVGRLDAESKGLLLLTNDGELTNQLTHPKYSVPKTYRAVVAGLLQAEEAERLQHGIWLAGPEGGGMRTTASRLRIVNRARDNTILEITLREGRNRQIRRMLANLGHKVRDLTRVSLGSLELKGVGPGQFRFLTDYEVRQLRRDITQAQEESLARAERRKDKLAETPEGEEPPTGLAGPSRPRLQGKMPVAMQITRPGAIEVADDDVDYVGNVGFPAGPQEPARPTPAHAPFPATSPKPAGRNKQPAAAKPAAPAKPAAKPIKSAKPGPSGGKPPLHRDGPKPYGDKRPPAGKTPFQPGGPKRYGDKRPSDGKPSFQQGGAKPFGDKRPPRDSRSESRQSQTGRDRRGRGPSQGPPDAARGRRARGGNKGPFRGKGRS